jgi:hypothetical protein
MTVFTFMKIKISVKLLYCGFSSFLMGQYDCFNRETQGQGQYQDDAHGSGELSFDVSVSLPDLAIFGRS